MMFLPPKGLSTAPKPIADLQVTLIGTRPYIYIYIYIYTGKPPPGSRNQWVKEFQACQLTGSMVTWLLAGSFNNVLADWICFELHACQITVPQDTPRIICKMAGILQIATKMIPPALPQAYEESGNDANSDNICSSSPSEDMQRRRE